mgnify:CR=1 FL=1
MCDQIRGRLDYLAKFGAPPDMTQTFATIIHVAPKMGVEEMMVVRKQLIALLGKEFELQCDEDKSIINPMVAENIDFRKPMDGEVIYRLRQLAKERNICYEPSHDARQALNHYLDFKGLSDPLDEGAGPAKISQPVYNPVAPLDANQNNQDNNNNQPPGFPPGNGDGGPGNVSMPPPQYPMHPQQPAQPQYPQQPAQPQYPQQPPPAYQPFPPPVDYPQAPQIA